MEKRPWNIKWIKRFKSDKHFGNKRFKKYDYKSPRFDIDERLMDNVSKFEFNKIDDDRLPFFVGTQFGLCPGINDEVDF